MSFYSSLYLFPAPGGSLKEKTFLSGRTWSEDSNKEDVAESTNAVISLVIPTDCEESGNIRCM